MFLLEESKWVKTFISGAVLGLLTFRLGLGTLCLRSDSRLILRALYNLLLIMLIILLNFGVIYVSCLTVPESDPNLFVRVCIGCYISIILGYFLYWPIFLCISSKQL